MGWPKQGVANPIQSAAAGRTPNFEGSTSEYLLKYAGSQKHRGLVFYLLPFLLPHGDYRVPREWWYDSERTSDHGARVGAHDKALRLKEG